jgi:DNA-binding NarL/FixJ family response regulator
MRMDEPQSDLQADTHDGDGPVDRRNQRRGLLRVLVVDGTPDFRMLMRGVLERTGDFVVVGEAGDGREAIDLAGVTDPDVVLLDIAMPTMGGLESLPVLRELCPAAALVMLSGVSPSRMRLQADALGADGYLEKGQPLRGLLIGLYRVVNRMELRSRASAGG